MEDAGDVVGVVDNLKDAHAAATLAADGDVEGEDPGEELGPADVTRSRPRRRICFSSAGMGHAPHDKRSRGKPRSPYRDSSAG